MPPRKAGTSHGALLEPQPRFRGCAYLSGGDRSRRSHVHIRCPSTTASLIAVHFHSWGPGQIENTRRTSPADGAARRPAQWLGLTDAAVKQGRSADAPVPFTETVMGGDDGDWHQMGCWNR